MALFILSSNSISEDKNRRDGKTIGSDKATCDRLLLPSLCNS